MKALDTNVLIRFLLNDEPVQSDKVHNLFLNAQKREERLFVGQLTLLETVWVLGSRYGFSRENLLSSLKKLFALPVLVFEKAEMLEEFAETASTSSVDLSDLLIALSAKSSQCETTLTFDRKAAKESKLFHLI